MKHIFIRIIGLLLVCTGLVAAFATASAQATDDDETCVPKDAYTETTDWVLESPGEGWYQVDQRTVVDKEASVEVIPGVAEVWANFAPTKPKTFVGPPAWPNDERGKWIVHNKIPGGHSGPDGVYSKGNPHKGGNWFYRHAGTPDQEIQHPAETHEEFKFAFDHEAVTCEPPVECPDGDLNGELPGCDKPEEPEEPVDPCKGRPVVGGPCAPVDEEPEPEIDTALTVTRECVGDALVTKTFEDGVAVSTDTKSGAARCAVGSDEGPADPIQEEGF